MRSSIQALPTSSMQPGLIGEYLVSTTLWESLRADQAKADVEDWLDQKLRALAHERLGEARPMTAVDSVRHRECDPAAAAEALVQDLIAILSGAERPGGEQEETSREDA